LLRVEEVPTPSPATNQVLLRVVVNRPGIPGGSDS
jgi:NADPH:quinone reductase-like Zn-dependent oxidoreductase